MIFVNTFTIFEIKLAHHKTFNKFQYIFSNLFMKEVRKFLVKPRNLSFVPTEKKSSLKKKFSSSLPE